MPARVQQAIETKAIDSTFATLQAEIPSYNVWPELEHTPRTIESAVTAVAVSQPLHYKACNVLGALADFKTDGRAIFTKIELSMEDGSFGKDGSTTI
eukprot:6463128-Amphidinium_carterae.2